MYTNIALRAVLLAAVAVAATASVQPLYRQPSAPIPDRVQDLMSRMTLLERARQMYAIHNYHGDEFQKYNQTSFGSLKLSSFKQENPADQVQLRNQLQGMFLNSSRLHIPLSWPQETLGSGGPNGVVFPLPVTLGSAFNASLVTSIHEIIAAEARITGCDIGYSPEVNLYADARFGRLQEGFSEDPFLTSVLGVAAVRGLQQDGGSGPGTPLQSSAIGSLAKHWVAYGAASMNAYGTDMSFRRLAEVFETPWRNMVKYAGLRGLMPSHQTIFDVPVHGNAWLGQTRLRQALNFSGVSVSDCSDVGVLYNWGVAANMQEAAIQGVEAGVDMDNMCGLGYDNTYAYEHVVDAVTAGVLDEALVNASCARVLAHKFAAGLFEEPFTDLSLLPRLNNATGQRLAVEAATAGIVLLENRANHLPLDMASVTKLGIVGENAGCFDSKGATATDSGICAAQSNAVGKELHVLGANATISTVIGEAKARWPSLDIVTARGSPIDTNPDDGEIAAAVASMQDRDLIVAVVGDSMHTCAEFGDRDRLNLPSQQLELLAQLAKLQKPLVVVLVHGRPATFEINGTDLLDSGAIDTLLTAWRPGQGGGPAIWNVLTGVVEPTGRLPNSWPRTVGQVGATPAAPYLQAINGKWMANGRGPEIGNAREFDPFVDGVSQPRYAFGYGIGFGNATIESVAVHAGSGATAYGLGKTAAIASVTVQAAGGNGGPTSVMVQLYVTPPITRRVRTWRRLAGFQRVTVDKTSAATIQVPISYDALMSYEPLTGAAGGPDAGTLGVVKGNWTVTAAFNALEEGVAASFML